MTDTPRTDAVLASYFNFCPSMLCDLARELERELNSANAAIRQHQLLEEENLRLKDRIKRLEEAGDAIYWAFMHPFDTGNESVADAWRKAKETKP